MKSFYIDNATNMPFTSSRVGDSGYVSFPGGLPCTGIVTSSNIDSSSHIAESEEEEEPSNANITDLTCNQEEVFLGNNAAGASFDSTKILDSTKRTNVVDGSVLSTVSSMWGDDTVFNENWDVPTPIVLEQLNNSDKKGSHRSEVQLRYNRFLYSVLICI